MESLYKFLIVITAIGLAFYILIYGLPKPIRWIKLKIMMWRCEKIFEKLSTDANTEEEKEQWKRAKRLAERIRKEEKLFGGGDDE